MKTNNTVINSIMNKYMKYLCAVLLIIGTSAHAWSAETVAATFDSNSLVDNSTYQEYSDANWTLSCGGGNDKAGYNGKYTGDKKIGNAFGTAATPTHHGFYIKSEQKLDNICKITFTYTFCSTASECDQAKIYLGYSTNGSTWNAVSLTTGTQGMGIGPNDDPSDGYNTAIYTLEFNKINSAYYAIIVSRNGAITDKEGFAFSHTTANFYSGCCDQIVTPAKGTRTNCEIAFSPEEVATCSSTDADRQLTVTLTPADCYAAPTADAVARASGIACTKVSGPLDNGDGSYNYVFQFAQNVTGTTTFNASVSTKKTYTVSYNKGTYGTGTNTSATKTCGENLSLPGVTFTRTGYTQAGWSTSAAGTSKAYNLSGSYTADAATTLYPYWEANTISITLDKNGGDANGSASVKYDATALTSKTDATRSEWNVVGYYAEPECTNKVLTNTGLLVNHSGYVEGGKWVRNSATTLYAKWSKTQYTVTFNMNGHGDAVPAQEVESGDPAVRPTPDPSADDWRFLGWFTAAEGGSEWNFSTGITGNTTIHAHWEAISYNTETYKAWCEPNISFSGDIHLTSVNGVQVYSTSTTSNLLHIISDDLSGVEKLEISYLDADNGDAVVANASSLFRLCNDGTENYNTADGTQIDVSGSNTCDLTYSIRYTPEEYGVINHYKLQVAMKRGSGVAVRTLKTATYDLYGRSLPEEFVVASKFGDEWYALPNTLEAIEKEAKAVAGIRITVDNTTTPEEALYAPTSTVYQGEGRYAANSHRYGIRLTNGTNHLQVSSTGSNNKMWLSPTGSSDNQDWWLSSTNFGAYSVTIPSNTGNETKKIGMYGGNIGYFASPTAPSGQIYFLPIRNKLIDVPASVTEWGQKSVILDVDAQTASSAQARFGNGSNEEASSFGQTTTSVNGAASKYNYTLTFSTTDFTSKEGQLLYIDWLDSEDEIIGTSTLTMPYIIASDGVMHTLDGTKGNWEKREVHVLPGATLTADAGEFGSKNVTVGTLEIYPGATVNVTTGTLNVTDLIMRNGWTRAGSKEYDVARLYITPSTGSLAATRAYADWYIDFDQYYPVAVPWSVTTSGMSYKNSNSAASAGVKMRYYDGASRATNGQAGVGDGANWKAFNNGVTPVYPATLTPGVGYAMTARRPTGKAFSIIRMPLTIPSTAWTTSGEQGEVSSVPKDQVTIIAHGVGEDKPAYTLGWNFIANPYMSIYQGPITHSKGSDYDVKYVNIPDIDFKEYGQYDLALGYKLLPSSGFFIQAGKTGTLTFGTTNRRASAPTYRAEGNTPVVEEQKAYIVLNNDKSEDVMGLKISENYTADYEINADLEKLLGDGTSLKTYMHYGDMSMAYVAINQTLAQEWIPVSVQLPEGGEYTFSLHEASVIDELEGVYLIDYTAGNVITNLLDNSYSFGSAPGTISGRFAINAIVGEHNTPTGIDVINGGGDINSDKPFKFIYHEKVYIYHRGVIYDATGKRVKEINK